MASWIQASLLEVVASKSHTRWRLVVSQASDRPTIDRFGSTTNVLVPASLGTTASHRPR